MLGYTIVKKDYLENIKNESYSFMGLGAMYLEIGKEYYNNDVAVSSGDMSQEVLKTRHIVSITNILMYYVGKSFGAKRKKVIDRLRYCYNKNTMSCDMEVIVSIVTAIENKKI